MSGLEDRRDSPRRRHVGKGNTMAMRFAVLLYSMLALVWFVGTGELSALVLTLLMWRWGLRRL